MKLQGGILSKRIPAIMGVVLLLGGLATALFLVGQSQGLFTRAGPTSTPRQVRVTNIDEDSVAISWITDTRVTGFVRYGESAGSLSKTLGDDRDQISGTAEMYTTHYVSIKGLKPNTKYFFKIGSGSTIYGEGETDTPYETATGGVIANKPAADVINGRVLLPSGQPAPGIIVYVEVPGGAPLSALTKTTGTWTLPLSSVRTLDLAGFLSYDAETTVLSILAQGADLGTATATVTTANDNPVPDITLGQVADLTVVTETAVAGAVIEIENNTLSTQRLEVIPGEMVSVINKDGVPHSVTAKDREFDTGLISGGGNATFNAPIAVGDYEFEDSANPGVESLMGVVTVAEEEVATVTQTGGSFSDLSAAAEATLSVKLLEPTVVGEDIATASPEIKVQGPVGTVVKITINSTPQSTTVTIDADGLVGWTPPSDLEPGEHSVTIEYTDSNGVLQRIVRSFTVLAAEPEGTGGLPTFSATPSAIPTASAAATPSAAPIATPSTEAGVPEAGVLTLTLALLTLGIGLFLAGLVWQVQLLKLKP